MHKVFIDGQAGTTGLQINKRLSVRDDIEVINIADADRKNPSIKKDIINSIDVVILCLPDEAARESVSLIENRDVKVLDASTAHRVHPDWVYGLPELSPGQREKIKTARWVSVPGCYPTGFILATAPLVKAGIIPSDYPITIQAVSGYSGGGRQMIESYREQEDRKDFTKIWPYRPYALQLAHKHLPEMRLYTGLKHKPLFVPAVAHIKQGMLVMVALHRHLLKDSDPSYIVRTFMSCYQSEPFIRVAALNDMDQLENGFLSPVDCNGTNNLDLMVFAGEEQLLLVSRLDNLGKGASGAAVQNLNLMLSVDESTGLV